MTGPAREARAQSLAEVGVTSPAATPSGNPGLPSFARADGADDQRDREGEQEHGGAHPAHATSSRRSSSARNRTNQKTKTTKKTSDCSPAIVIPPSC